MKKSSHRVKAIARPYIAISMLAAWTLSAFSGFLLWLAPTGPRSGRMLLLFGLSKQEWGDYHFWFSTTALALTVIHLIVDWKGFRSAVLYLLRNDNKA